MQLRLIVSRAFVVFACLLVVATAHIAVHAHRHYAEICNLDSQPVSVSLTAEGGFAPATLLNSHKIMGNSCANADFHNRADRQFAIEINNTKHLMHDVFDTPYAFTYKKYKYNISNDEITSEEPREFILGFQTRPARSY